MIKYRLRSGNYIKKKSAQMRVQKLKNLGVDSFIYTASNSKRYKVQVGMFDKKQNAKNYKAELKKKGINSKIIKVEVQEMAFTPRLTRTGMQGNQYWYSNSNPYYARGNGLPNCTCYVFGRWWEILGTVPTELGNLGNGGQWYNNAPSTLTKGSVPQLGAIACWYDPSGYRLGHVAVVEQIMSNGDIITSNSGYTRNASEMDNLYFWTETCSKSQGYRSTWEINWGYRLAGFIYLNGAPVTKAWIYGNRYLNQTEMENNSECAFDYLYSLGFSVNSIYAILGNAQQESGINPAIWENLTVDYNRGYGLFQFTPATYYTDWATQHGYSIEDGYAQLDWVDSELDQGGYWVQRSGYNISFQDFKTDTTHSIDWLTSAWYYNFENPGPSDTTEQARRNYANAWETYFQGYTPSDPINPPIYVVREGLKIWQMINYHPNF